MSATATRCPHEAAEEFIAMLRKVRGHKVAVINARLYRVVSNVKPPPRYSSMMRLTLKSCAVGDSFLIEDDSRINAFVTARRVGVRVKTSSEGDLRRVWRVA